MALSDLLGVEKKRKGYSEITEDVLREHVDEYRQLIAYWRMYPDRLIDYYCSLNPKNEFHLFFYQRLFLRCLMRHKNVYATFVRAWSKSFMSVMALFLKCVLYPGLKCFTVAGGKEQSASILSEKLEEICKLIPAMSKEIIWETRGARDATTRKTKDSVVYTFKNGSRLSNVAANEASRGKRFHCGLMEECVSIDQEILNAVIIPTMNVDRRVKNEVTKGEPVNKSQTYVTTAGYKGTFSYEKLLEILCRSVARPKENIILGGSWRTPVIEGLLDKDFVAELRMDGTFNEATFEREYESLWTGNVEDAFFDSALIDRNRIIKLPEYESSGKTSSKGYYVLGVDVGRHRCTTEVCVIKVTPAQTGVSYKRVVNIYSMEAEHFGAQAINIKKIFNRYNCKIAVVDGQGVGQGLVDFLITDQIDPDTGEMLFNWGVYNDDERKYKNFETPDTIYKAMYIMRANAPLNTEMYSYCQTQLQHGKIKFLVDDKVAKAKLSEQSQWAKMSRAAQAEKLVPYVQTNILKEQMCNLVEKNEGMNIMLKPNNGKIKHDKFSALIYGLYWCKLQEDKGRKKTRNIKDFMFFTAH